MDVLHILDSQWLYTSIAAPPPASPALLPAWKAPPLLQPPATLPTHDSPSERLHHGAAVLKSRAAAPRDVAACWDGGGAPANHDEVGPPNHAQPQPQLHKEEADPGQDLLSAFTRAGRPACLSAALSSKRRVWPQSRSGLPTRVRDLRVNVPRSDPGVAPHEVQQLLHGGFWRASAPPARPGAAQPWEQALGRWMQLVQHEAEAAVQRLRTSGQQLGALLTCCLPATWAPPTASSSRGPCACPPRAASAQASLLSAPPQVVVAHAGPSSKPPHVTAGGLGGFQDEAQGVQGQEDVMAMQPPLPCPGGGALRDAAADECSAAMAAPMAAPEPRAPIPAAMSWPGPGGVAPRSAHHRTSSTFAAHQVWGQVAEQVSSHLSWSEPVSSGGGGSGGDGSICTDGGRPAQGASGAEARRDARSHKIQQLATAAAPALLPVDSASDMQKQQQQQRQSLWEEPRAMGQTVA